MRSPWRSACTDATPWKGSDMSTKKRVTIMFVGHVPLNVDPIHWHWGDLLGVADWWVDEGERTVHVGVDAGEPRCDVCDVHTEDADAWCPHCGNCADHCAEYVDCTTGGESDEQA